MHFKNLFLFSSKSKHLHHSFHLLFEAHDARLPWNIFQWISIIYFHFFILKLSSEKLVHIKTIHIIILCFVFYTGILPVSWFLISFYFFLFLGETRAWKCWFYRVYWCLYCYSRILKIESTATTIDNCAYYAYYF